MSTISLVLAATVFAAGTAMSLPADARADGQVRGTVMFWLLDRNNDGAIDRSEVEALRTVIFDAVDTDSDGRVTRAEFMAVTGDRGGPRRRERGDRQDGPGKGDFAGHRGERTMERLGIDADDGLSKDDFVGASPALLERADEDGDGTVSRSELEQASRHIGRLLVME